MADALKAPATALDALCEVAAAAHVTAVSLIEAATALRLHVEHIREEAERRHAMPSLALN